MNAQGAPLPQSEEKHKQNGGKETTQHEARQFFFLSSCFPRPVLLSSFLHNLSR